MPKNQVGQKVKIIFNGDGEKYDDTVGQYCTIVLFDEQRRRYKYDVQMATESKNHGSILGMDEDNFFQSLQMRLKELKDAE